MLELFLFSVLVGMVAAVIGFGYVNILADPEHILGPLNKFLTWHLKDRREQKGKPEHFLYKPLIGCSVCNTGQWAMWIYVTVIPSTYVTLFPVASVTLLIFSICLALIFAVTLNRIFDK